MSELIINTKKKDLRWQLLTTVSAASLLVAVAGSESVTAQEADHPTVWVELGGQLEGMRDVEEPYAPPFILGNVGKHADDGLPYNVQQPPHFGFGGEGKLSFEPKGSDWVFSAAVRFGRSNGKRAAHQQTQSQFTVHTIKYATNHGKGTVTQTRFNDARVYYSTEHAVVDFTAGKDVGLGLFGQHATSTLNVGVRIAQMNAKSDVVLRSVPSHHVTVNFANFFHTYYARSQIERTFRGIGPSISWDGSAPVMGHRDGGELTFDWGANAAALFGRQKVLGSHKTTSWVLGGAGQPVNISRTAPIGRSRSLLVPNLGGFAGVSLRYTNVKLSAGYRADFFFGAMDGGGEMRKSETQGFYGPFATVSIGFP